ncbi:hypothetical protein FGB62_4g051 [Gracilaria domingensis]|nr:hypothetical protein FGB62_4g051 [Gracilaria domingensis]
MVLTRKKFQATRHIRDVLAQCVCIAVLTTFGLHALNSLAPQASLPDVSLRSLSGLNGAANNHQPARGGFLRLPHATDCRAIPRRGDDEGRQCDVHDEHEGACRHCAVGVPAGSARARRGGNQRREGDGGGGEAIRRVCGKVPGGRVVRLPRSERHAAAAALPRGVAAHRGHAPHRGAVRNRGGPEARRRVGGDGGGGGGAAAGLQRVLQRAHDEEHADAGRAAARQHVAPHVRQRAGARRADHAVPRDQGPADAEPLLRRGARQRRAVRARRAHAAQRPRARAARVDARARRAAAPRAHLRGSAPCRAWSARRARNHVMTRRPPQAATAPAPHPFARRARARVPPERPRSARAPAFRPSARHVEPDALLRRRVRRRARRRRGRVGHPPHSAASPPLLAPAVSAAHCAHSGHGAVVLAHVLVCAGHHQRDAVAGAGAGARFVRGVRRVQLCGAAHQVRRRRFASLPLPGGPAAHGSSVANEHVAAAAQARSRLSQLRARKRAAVCVRQAGRLRAQAVRHQAP